MFSAITKESQLLKGDSESPVAIISLWTRKEEVAKAVPRERYCVIGQLYSPARGIDILVRNLLANPGITNLVVTGEDLSGSGEALLAFFTSGVEEKVTQSGVKAWRIVGRHDAFIGGDIPEAELERLRKGMHVARIRELTSLKGFVPKKMPLREKAVYAPAEAQAGEYSGEDAGYLVREKTVASAWLHILSLIMKYGKISTTQFDSRQKEIIDMVSVISEEDPSAPGIPAYFPFDAAHFTSYKERFLGNAKTEGVSYTYGNRMRGFFGKDQVESVIMKLAADIGSRQGVISLWDSGKDLEGAESPCLNHLWVRVRENRVYLSATLRSNDMYAGYPENALALRALQEHIRKRLSMEVYKGLAGHDFGLGELVIMSHSAHIYEECWGAASAVIESEYRPGFSVDERGSFFITLDLNAKLIYVDYLAKNGEKAATFKGRSALALRDALAREDVVGTASHGIYLGIELCKAEGCLLRGIPYTQDEEVRWDK